MAVNAFFITTVLFMALGLWLLEACRFLIPYRALLIHQYGGAIALFAVTLFLNIFAVIYSVARTLFLKDTGRKLAHLEKQLRTGAALSEDLAERLRN